jgi:hypothetical protein
MVELAGPDAIPMDEFVRRFLTTTADARPVVADASAGYFGVPVDDHTLTPGDHPLLGSTHFEGWLSHVEGRPAAHS